MRRTKKEKTEIIRRDLRMALGKVRRRGLYYLPFISIVFVFILNFIFFTIVIILYE